MPTLLQSANKVYFQGSMASFSPVQSICICNVYKQKVLICSNADRLLLYWKLVTKSQGLKKSKYWTTVICHTN